MRFNTLVLLAALAGAGYFLWTRLAPPPPPPPPPPVAAGPTQVRMTCPACGGEGQLMLIRGHAKMDKPYACPICGGRGFVARVPPPGAQACPDCKGMGKRLYNSQTQRFVNCPPSEKELAARLHGSPCQRCGSTGYLVKPPGR
ncbi:MAG TPA: hypothetical protein P5567_14975 [Kiritimatiellia bacterium]|nr:hypothetical protein [Kiritimatiellia bacterium]HSA19348.1 hypothetical protein [Kiritimatiellia bacterium]